MSTAMQSAVESCPSGKPWPTAAAKMVMVHEPSTSCQGLGDTAGPLVHKVISQSITWGVKGPQPSALLDLLAEVLAHKTFWPPRSWMETVSFSG